MNKEMKPKKARKKQSKRMITLLVIVVLGLSAVLYAASASRSATPKLQDADTVSLHKTEITNAISVSGQIDSSNVINIYSSLINYPVKQVLVKVGDKVKKGDVLAEMDVTSLEYDIKQARNDLSNAERTRQTEKKNNQNSIANAENALSSAVVAEDRQRLAHEKSLADLKEAEAAIVKPFDPYTYNQAITEAQATLDKRRADLQEAGTKLDNETNAFDTYAYDHAIQEAKVVLERKTTELAKAKKDKDSGYIYFDSSSYSSMVNTAQVSVDRSQKDYDLALAENNNDLTAPAVVAARRILEDAASSLSRAKNDMNKAQLDFFSSTKSTVDAATSKVTSAQNEWEDAQKAYDKATTDLDRARKKSVEDATKNVNVATIAVQDAERAHTTAMTDRQRAQDKAGEDNTKQLTAAKRSVADSEKSLEAAKLSVSGAQNSLQQAKLAGLSSSSSSANQQVILDKLLDQLSQAKIIASGNGTVTAVNAKAGTNPNGTLFTLEDTHLLYVSAKVKEYNLKQLSIGQRVSIATDATNRTVFEGELIYISPKAVSEAGSTNVEFEIWVAIKQPTEQLKIGMNAFLEIIIERKNEVYVVPLSALITNEQGTFVRSLIGEQTVDLPVTIGIKTSTSVEIAGEGIKEGVLILNSPDTSPAAADSSLLNGVGM